MRGHAWRQVAAGAAIGIAALLSAPAAADPVRDFYKDKTITLLISVGEGDGLDKAARLIARHWSRHIPGNPVIIPKNMPGAGSLRATSFLYNQAPKDGTTIGAIIPAFVMQQLLSGAGVDYDAARFEWLGSSNASNSTIYVWHDTGVTSLQQAMTRELVMGATGVGSNSAHYPVILNHVLGTKFKLVMGYRAAPAINIAIERGEVQGRAGETFSTLQVNHPAWLAEKKINILVQIGRDKERGFEAVPQLTEFAKDEMSLGVLRIFSNEVALGRPYLAPPGVPPARVAALRASFAATMRDPALLAEAKRMHLDFAPTEGETLDRLVKELVNTNKDVIARAKQAYEIDKISTR